MTKRMRDEVQDDHEETLVPGSAVEFVARFETLKRIGKGAFSIVSACIERSTSRGFAVKTIDLRPLRLRSDFSAHRLLREAWILSQLCHENVVSFVGCYQSNESQWLVMERLTGRELFEVILKHDALEECVARPILRQVCSALAYLHSNCIAHRDIKPENVIVLDDGSGAEQVPSPLWRIKLIDFGLSKILAPDRVSVSVTTDANSSGDATEHKRICSHKRISHGDYSATTFVGTPCYLAPEIEATHRGGVGAPTSYDVGVDVWSLGAVLNVMLVARFPQFDRSEGRVEVRLDASGVWDRVSPEAKDLVRGLMRFEPTRRLTAGEALEHAWVLMEDEPAAPRSALEGFTSDAPVLESFSSDTGTPVCPVLESFSSDDAPVSPGPFDHSLPCSPMSPLSSPISVPPPPTMPSMPSMPSMPAAVPPARDSVGIGALEIDSLLDLQQTIGLCLRNAYSVYSHVGEVSQRIRESAVLCRGQFLENTKLLRKIEHTALAVLDIHDDLELAVHTGNPELAHELFRTVKEWVGGLRFSVTGVQQGNKEQIVQLHAAIYEVEKCLGSDEDAPLPTSPPPPSLLHPNLATGEDQSLLLDAPSPTSPIAYKARVLDPRTAPPVAADMNNAASSFDSTSSSASSASAAAAQPPVPAPSAVLTSSQSHEGQSNAQPVKHDSFDSATGSDLAGSAALLSTVAAGTSAAPPAAASNPQDGAVDEPYVAFAQALSHLERVDDVLARLALLWGNTEVIFDMLLHKSEHIEKFLDFVVEPRLLERFRVRLEEYKSFWIRVHELSHSALAGPGATQPNQPASSR